MHRVSKLFVLVLTIGLLAFAPAYAKAQSPYFSKWPAGSSPAEVGKRVAEKFLARKLEAEEGKRKFVIYPEVCAWYGSLTVAQLTKDADLKAKLIAKFEPLMTPEGAKMISQDAHVDYRVLVLCRWNSTCRPKNRDTSIWAKASLTSNGTRPRPTGLRPRRVTGSMTCS